MMTLEELFEESPEDFEQCATCEGTGTETIDKWQGEGTCEVICQTCEGIGSTYKFPRYFDTYDRAYSEGRD